MPRKPQPPRRHPSGIIDTRRLLPDNWEPYDLQYYPVCEQCGEKFVHRSNSRKPKYCGDTCRQRAHRLRHRS